MSPYRYGDPHDDEVRSMTAAERKALRLARELMPHQVLFTQEDIDAAVVAEREACAQLCVEESWSRAYDSATDRILIRVARAIRARGGK